MVRSRPSNRPRSSGCDRLWSHSPNVVASQKRCKRLGAQARGVMLRGGGDSLGDHLLGLTVLPGSGRDRPVVPLDLVLAFQLPYGEWVRLFRIHSFEVLDLIEPRPAPDAVSSYRDDQERAWSRRWPANVSGGCAVPEVSAARAPAMLVAVRQRVEAIPA